MEQRSEVGSSAGGQASVLTLQLEGAFGCSMSVSETGSREDTLSPMVSMKTGESVLVSVSQFLRKPVN